ncbi:MAG: NrdJb [Gammaproteobacteria bacterium]|nr:MAG: NrdJb [Gammaproteobacteria bacterium]
MKISGKIVGYAVRKPGDADDGAATGTATGAATGETTATGGAAADSNDEPATANVIHMHETLQRPEKLVGSTYKLKVPEHVSPHAIYITINDIVLNEGTEHEHRRPFEVFINSKNLEHYQWIVALTLIMSAVFRKGGDIAFLVDELRSVFDPRGGYWNHGKYTPSIIAEIGDIIESHLTEIGMLKKAVPDAAQQVLIDQKKAELAGDATTTASDAEAAGNGNDTAPAGEDAWKANATLCNKCHQKAVVLKDGCQTCLECGDSKCG